MKSLFSPNRLATYVFAKSSVRLRVSKYAAGPKFQFHFQTGPGSDLNFKFCFGPGPSRKCFPLLRLGPDRDWSHAGRLQCGPEESVPCRPLLWSFEISGEYIFIWLGGEGEEDCDYSRNWCTLWVIGIHFKHSKKCYALEYGFKMYP